MKKLFSTIAVAGVLAAGLAAPAQAAEPPKDLVEKSLKVFRKRPCSEFDDMVEFRTASKAWAFLKSKPASRPLSEKEKKQRQIGDASGKAMVIRSVECGYLKDDLNPLGKVAGSFKGGAGSSFSS